MQVVLPELLHGEAVNISMAFMCTLSHVKGYLSEEDLHRILRCMQNLQLPMYHEACSLDLVRRALQDRLKHSGGKLRMPLPIKLGYAGELEVALNRTCTQWTR